MPALTVEPVEVVKLDDWSRRYAFDFAATFVEFQGASPPTISSYVLTADSGITATDLGESGGVVTVRIAGGTAGTTYAVEVEATLSTGDVVSIPAAVSVVSPGDPFNQTTLVKLPHWQRHYLFQFGKYFEEFSSATPPGIASTPTFHCDPAGDGSTVSGTPNFSGSVASVFITGGNALQSYQIRCTVTTTDGDTLSIPGILGD